ncbi:MAG: hypothetical protein M2R45_03110 [Verrucomicrobia subdivision 3 bacterium]|nr:hypothetical protein [Limisphaerales bacterium]MCS1413178.1 hypothetical protein [Limisphaerales bacterium]
MGPPYVVDMYRYMIEHPNLERNKGGFIAFDPKPNLCHAFTGE